MKRLLFVSFDFPPRRTSAVYRHVGLLRYLARLGWQPTALTVRELGTKQWEGNDATLLARLPPQVEIERTHYFSAAAWETPAGAAIRNVGGLRVPTAKASPRWFDRYLRSLADLIRSCLYFPDQTVGWILPGVARALELHFERRFDVVYTSSPPRSAPVIGLLLKILTGVTWVAEFRDPWYPPQRRLRRRFEHWLQSFLLRKADAVVLISQGYAEEIKRKYKIPAERVFVVSNGYDEEDFAGRSERPAILPSGFIHLSHFGIVYPKFSGSFFPAVAQLLRDDPMLKSRLRINIIGYADEEVLRYAQDPALAEVIQLYGFMRHEDAIQAMYESDGLLLFLADAEVSRLSGLGKIYWYLRVGRPILAVTPAGGSRELIEQAAAGWAVTPDQTDAIKHVLRTLLAGRRNGSPPRPARPEFVAQFRYEALATRLAEVLSWTGGSRAS